MGSIGRTLIAMSGALAIMAAALETGADGVKTTPDSCASAHAILMATPPDDSGAHPEHNEAIKRVISYYRHWEVVPTVERMISQKMALKVWEFSGGGSAWVAHCGHGGTCNEVARAINKAYPNTHPVVLCGEIPGSLDNPREM